MRVRQALEGEPGIASLQTNPLTGSVLVLHNLDAHRLAEIVESRGLFHLDAQSSNDATQVGHSDSLFASFGSFMRPHPSPQYGLAVALVVLAVFEAAQANITAPAVTLLWYAFRLLQEQPAISGRAASAVASEGQKPIT